MKKVIIVDDEKMARILLKGMIEEYHHDFEVIDMCEDLISAIKSIKKNSPDLVFLDIEMPNHNGLELLDFFHEDEIQFSIIFTTAYSQYAVQAFKLSAIDYLLKPIEPQELEESLLRFKKFQNKSQLNLLKENFQFSIPKIALPISRGVKFIPIPEIGFFKADGSYTEVFLKQNQHFMISKNLKTIEDIVSGMPQFFRCHKSYLINVMNIDEFIKSDGGFITIFQQKIPISTDRVDDLMRILET